MFQTVKRSYLFFVLLDLIPHLNVHKKKDVKTVLQTCFKKVGMLCKQKQNAVIYKLFLLTTLDDVFLISGSNILHTVMCVLVNN